MTRTVVGIFSSGESAESATREAHSQGFEHISVMAKKGEEENNDNISDGTMTGGVLGGAAGLLIGMGAIAVPGLGVLAAAGPLAGILSGAVAGGLVGSMVDLGIPENHSRKYEEHIKSGKFLWTVKTEDDKSNRIAEILRDHGAIDVSIY